jgi:hypothetical protein
MFIVIGSKCKVVEIFAISSINMETGEGVTLRAELQTSKTTERSSKDSGMAKDIYNSGSARAKGA